ncbi:MAG: hypothetical protein KY475_25005 [Planctomycetes bacterium]|nr:hypothetical protein [Planctomycetota bacterium]
MTTAAQARSKLPWKLRPKLLSNFNGNSQKLATVAPGLNISGNTAMKFDVAMLNWGNDIGGRPSEWKHFASKFTVADLAQCSGAEQIAILDEIWKEMVEFRPYATPVGGMVDPGAGNYTSSVTRPTEPIFNRYGICFRCDGRNPSSVLAYGFKPEYNFSPPAHVVGTIMQNCTTGAGGIVPSAGFWIGNRDIVNQTSICVGRRLKGCGKFPTPSSKGVHHFYAFKFSTEKKGFDTEARQVQTGGRWLPGEKAFPIIIPNEIIAYTKIIKLGCDTGGLAFNWYSYTILDKVWTFTPNATSPEKAYLKAELDAITGGEGMKTITVHKNEDFVAGQ